VFGGRYGGRDKLAKLQTRVVNRNLFAPASAGADSSQSAKTPRKARGCIVKRASARREVGAKNASRKT
jgi:hypothetical protein